MQHARHLSGTSSRAKDVSKVSMQLQPQQMPFPDRALQQT